MPDSNPANDVAGYAAAVRAALAPLPDEERESLLEDLVSHLEEVASESDVPLRERLGEPAAYAAELQSAYGTSSTAERPRRRRPVRDKLLAWTRAAMGARAYQEVRAMLPELRPGWWILRAYLAVLFLAFMFRDGNNLTPIPNPFSSQGLVQVLATAAAIVISVRLGRRGTPVHRRWQLAATGANVAIALLALPVLVSMGTGYSYPYMNGGDPNANTSGVVAGTYLPGVTNIFPYSADGKLLKGVLLYDQDGRPLVLDTGGLTTNIPVGADGLPITNAYPQDERDPNGAAVLPPRVALPPQPSVAATPSPAASPAAASPSPTPTH